MQSGLALQPSLTSTALNVRWRMGDRDVARARKLVASALPAATVNAPAHPKLSVEAVGWLLPVPFYFLELLVGLVQAFVFMLLTTVFTALICTHEEEHAQEHH